MFSKDKKIRVFFQKKYKPDYGRIPQDRVHYGKAVADVFALPRRDPVEIVYYLK